MLAGSIFYGCTPMKRRLRLLLLWLLALCARPFVRPHPPAPAALLYIKPDHLGDVLLATPALAALRQAHPGAQISALLGPWSALVLRRNPDIDRLLTCPFPGFERQAAPARTPQQRLGALLRPYALLLRYALWLRAGRYDIAIIGRDDHWWGAALALLAGIPQRVGFAVPECRPFLTTVLPWDPAAHVSAQGLALAAAVGEALPAQGEWRACYPARFEPAPADLAWVEQWLQSQGLAGQPLVLLHPGTGGPAKLWENERWVAVAEQLVADGARLLLTGGPGEELLVEQLAGGMRQRPLVLAGQTTLGQLAALMRRATLVLGVDSGPLHLAAAQGVATIHLYGPGDPGRFGPWGDLRRHLVLRADVWCSPCGVFGACPRGMAQPECMQRIGAPEVIAQARATIALEQRNRRSRPEGGRADGPSANIA